MKYNLSKFCYLAFYLVLTIILSYIKNTLAAAEQLKNTNSFVAKANSENSNLISLKNEKAAIGSSLQSQAKAKSQLKSLFSLGVKSFAEFKNLKVENRFQGYPKATVDLNNTAEIGQGPIYFEGWNKYFILKNTKGFEMKEFYVNGAYFKEQTADFKKKHKETSENYIPHANEFYLILTDEYLNVVSSKFNDLLTTVDILELKDLYDIDIADDNTFKGGVEDLGNFREGFCILLKGSNATGKFKWVVCANSFNAKFQLIKRLVILRIRCQLKSGTLKSNSITSTKIKIHFGEVAFESRHNTTRCNESKWIQLQDWSSCTLACGGGTQTLHRYCLRSPTGPPCVGESVIMRPCNTQPCTNVTEDIPDAEILPTQIKVIPVSLRPRIYRKCVIKEEDMNIVRDDLGNLRVKPRIPSRVILNNRTITIFESGSYQSILKSFYLRELIYYKEWEEDESCLKLQDHSKYAILCVMCTAEKREEEIKQWIRDIIEFRDMCSRPPKKPKGEDPRIIRYKKELEVEDIIKTMRETKKIDEQKKKIDEIKTIKLAQILALKALDKEREYEKRLEYEQTLKEQKEDEEMEKQYLCEERKKAILLRTLMEKKEEVQKNEAKEKLEEIQRDLKLKIILQRKKLLRRLNLIKLAHQRKRSQLKQHIMDVRRVLTQNILTAEKTGDTQNCLNPLGNESHIKRYCSIAYSSDPESELECKNSDNFCYLCCENEFGEAHKDERDKCIGVCEKAHDKIYDKKLEEDYKLVNLTTIEISVDPKKYERFIN